MFIDKYFINELSDKEVEFKLDQIESTLTTLLDINSILIILSPSYY